MEGLFITENLVESRRKVKGLRESSFIASPQTTAVHCAYGLHKTKQIN